MKIPYKKYDIISLLLIMITLMMFLLATNLFLVNRNLITANAYSNKSVNVENSQYQDFRKKIFIYMFN